MWLFGFFYFYHSQAELMEFKQKQEEEARTRAHQNEQRRYDAKMQNTLRLNSYLERLSKLQAFML